MRVLICGGRDYKNQIEFDTVMASLHDRLKITCVISGGARGADAMAEKWADENKIPKEIYQARWDVYGKAAGHWRNARMLGEGRPQLCIAFPGGRGTADMVHKCETAGVTVQKIF